jgi:hypothetical protein
MFDSEINGFVATQTAGKQQRKKCTVSLAFEFFTVRGLPCFIQLRREQV